MTPKGVGVHGMLTDPYIIHSFIQCHFGGTCLSVHLDPPLSDSVSDSSALPCCDRLDYHIRC